MLKVLTCHPLTTNLNSYSLGYMAVALVPEHVVSHRYINDCATRSNIDNKALVDMLLRFLVRNTN